MILLFEGLSYWGSVANIVLAAMSVFTAIITAWVLVRQYYLQKEQFEAQQLEHQPIFQIEKNEEGTMLSISNNGNDMGNVVDVYLLTVMCIDIYDRTELGYICNGMCVPVKYYNQKKNFQKLKGSLAIYDTTLEVKDKLIQIENKIQKILAEKYGERNVEINNTDLIEISYKDMYDKNRSIYYFDVYRTKRHHINKYWKSADMFNDNPIEVDNLNIQEIVDAVIERENTFEEFSSFNLPYIK